MSSGQRNVKVDACNDLGLANYLTNQATGAASQIASAAEKEANSAALIHSVVIDK